MVRHSKATSVSIRVAWSPTRLEATIADNGAGFTIDPETGDPAAHMGLHSMRERAAILGGTVEIASGAAGTTIAVALPLG